MSGTKAGVSLGSSKVLSVDLPEPPPEDKEAGVIIYARDSEGNVLFARSMRVAGTNGYTAAKGFSRGCILIEHSGGPGSPVGDVQMNIGSNTVADWTAIWFAG